MDAKGELMITIMSSLAQEESRSISENTTWGRRKRFADGKVSLPYKHFLGYEKGEDDLPRIVEQEAKVVRLIYQLFLEGKTTNAIAKRLENDGIPSPSGKMNWSKTTIEHILKNEKYKGDAILQKTFTVDFLTKKQKLNEGEVPQYYVKNSHPAIVSSEVFDLAQAEIKRRRALKYVSAASCFSSKIICGECGGFFGSKVWHSTSKYRRTVWQCNQKFENDQKCQTPHLYEDAIMTAFVTVMNRVIQNKNEILESHESIIRTLTDTRALDEKVAALKTEIESLTERIRLKILDNALQAKDQAEYQRQFERLTEQCREVERQLIELENQRQVRLNRERQIHAFLRTLMAQESLISTFDEEIWNALVESVTVHSGKRLTFRFRDGSVYPA